MARGTDGGLELKKITDEQVEERTVSALHTSGRPKPVHHHPPPPPQPTFYNTNGL